MVLQNLPSDLPQQLGVCIILQAAKVGERRSFELVEILRKKNKHVKIFFAEIPPLRPQWEQKKLCGKDTTYDQRIKEPTAQS
jgi:hypothetical protein